MSAGPDRPHRLDEQLSAWLDDELPAQELELLASRLARSPEHRARAARYGLIGSTLRSGQAGPPAVGLAALQVSARVSAVLDSLDAPLASPGVRRTARLLPYAAAAGVALLAIALVPMFPLPSGLGTPPSTGPAVPPASVPATLMPVRAQSLMADRVGTPGQSSLSPRRLTSYLVYHGEYAGVLSAKLTDSHIVNNRAYAVATQTADPAAAR